MIITTSQPNVLAVNAAAAGEERAGADRLREGQSRQAQLRVGRQRQLVAPQHGTPEVAGGHRRRARAVQRFAARRHRDDAGRDADDVRGDAAAAAADPGRASCARSRSPRPSASRCCPTCRRSPSPATPASRRWRGTACWFPPARRKPIVARLNSRDQRDPEGCPTSCRRCMRRASTSSAARRRSSAALIDARDRAMGAGDPQARPQDRLSRRLATFAVRPSRRLPSTPHGSGHALVRHRLRSEPGRGPQRRRPDQQGSVDALRLQGLGRARRARRKDADDLRRRRLQAEAGHRHPHRQAHQARRRHPRRSSTATSRRSPATR